MRRIIAVTPQVAQDHGLSPDEYSQILRTLGRTPTFEELGVFSVMWSEHCSYKSSRRFLRQLPTTGPEILQGPGENAGIVAVGDGLAVVFKIESHNHPSFIEPYHGAATGVGGIIRDVFTMGARPIASLNSLRFGAIDHPRTPYLVKGVVGGIGGYGNCVAGDERLMFLNDDHVYNLTIREFAQRYGADHPGATVTPTHPVRILSVDPTTAQSIWQPVRRIFRRQTNQLLHITTTLGRSIALTPDHPTVVVKEGRWQIVPASSLHPGDRLPLIKHFPLDQKDHPLSVDLIEQFQHVRPDIYVELPQPFVLPAAALKRWRSAVPDAGRRHSYSAKGRMPLGIFLAFEQDFGIPRTALRLYLPGGKAQHLRAIWPIDKALGRLMGYFLSEGCVSKNGGTYKVIWTFAVHETEYVQEVCTLLSQLGLRFSTEDRGSVVAVTTSSWFLGELLASIWKAGFSSDEKAIPELFLRQKQEVRIEILKGLLRGDGSVVSYPNGSRLKVSFCTASKVLAHQVLLLLQDLGIAASIYERPESTGSIQGRALSFKRTYHIEFHNQQAMQVIRGWFSAPINERIDKALAGYHSPDGRYSAPRYRDEGHYYSVSIRSIEVEERVQEVFDVEVSDTHLFVCGEGFITHNCVGVPTVGGEVYFDEGYNGNILVNAFTLGTVRTDRIFRARAAGVGNPVMYVGSRTGRDGIHGASLLASREFDAKSEELRPAVQVGDPFTEKLLIEACLELMQRDLIVAIQDMGAAGLTSSSVEMAGRGGMGIRLNLNAIPTREENISPYELLLSESQERMLIVAKAGCEEEVRAIFSRWDLQAEVVGAVTDDGQFRTFWDGEEVACIPVSALTDEAPAYERPAQQPADLADRQRLDLSAIPLPTDYGAVLLSLLTSPNLASKEWVYRQYDSFVCGNTVVQPGSDAAIIRLKGTSKGIGLTVDCNSRYCLLDPYRGGQIAVTEGARNLAVSGARPVALSDCLNFGNPEKPEVMWQFQQAIAGMRDACLALGLAVVSGNVSFYNETEGRAIPPTPTIATVGILDDVTHHVTQWFKQAGDVIVLLGETKEELGASEYLKTVHGRTAGAPPTLDLAQEKRLQELCLTAAREQLFSSAHDVAEGGLALALAEACITRPGAAIGARVTVPNGVRPDALLFGESQSRVLVSLPSTALPRLQSLAQAADIPLAQLGEVGGTDLDLVGYLRASVDMLQEKWRTALARQLDKSR
jgi:phosphoribosylformylglycinamidine synthase